VAENSAECQQWLFRESKRKSSPQFRGSVKMNVWLHAPTALTHREWAPCTHFPEEGVGPRTNQFSAMRGKLSVSSVNRKRFYDFSAGNLGHLTQPAGSVKLKVNFKFETYSCNSDNAEYDHNMLFVGLC